MSGPSFGTSSRESWSRVRNGPGLKTPEQHELMIGRIRHEMVKVPRGEQMMGECYFYFTAF